MEHDASSGTRSITDKYFAYMEGRKLSDRFLLYAFALTLLGSLGYTLLAYNEEQKTTVASRGGTLVEGVVGAPRFANPVLAITRADLDIVSLVYSGLMRVGPEGDLEPDLAETITISDDGLVYNVELRDDALFHDNVPVTANDVAYTITLIQDPMLKSPLRGNWSGVTVEVLGEHELNFVLEEPHAPFIENLTVGILPKHIWGDLSIEQMPFSQHNTEPIGSGPYELARVNHNKSGLIDSYTLIASPQRDETAQITNIELKFYPNEETLAAAFNAGELTGTAAFSYEMIDHIDRSKYTIIEHPLPRTFAVFFNQNRSPALRESAVREALSAAIDRDQLVDTVLHGYGVPTNSPIPPGFLAAESASATVTPETATTGIRYAEELLLDAGWTQLADSSWHSEIDGASTTLSVTLATANGAVFEETAAYLKSAWESLGVEVSTELFEQSDLVQASIRPRTYEALLFGAEVGRSLDLYPFWHSSQREDPGLNVALYTNITTDDLLEDARTTQDESERGAAIREFEREINSETPAVFLYSPSFTYVLRSDITTPAIERVVRPSERFSNIHTWHMSESNVWPLFAH